MEKIREILDSMEYWQRHMLVAFIIFMVLAVLILVLTSNLQAAVIGGSLAGVAFYSGHEEAQYFAKGYWDWPGFAAPVGLMLVFFVWGLVI